MSKKQDFLNMALSQVGYKEKGTNNTKYGEWYGTNPAPWCAMFISWCANQVGVLNKLIPKYKGCGTGYNWFKNKNLITMKPKAGDIGFLKPTTKTGVSSHTFIVYSVSGNKITTIEGNLDNQVKKNTRNITDKNILGFGAVQWGNDSVYKYVDNVDYQGLNVHKGKLISRIIKIGIKVEVKKTSGDKSYITSTEWVYSKYLSNKMPTLKEVKGADKEGLTVRNKPSILGRKITLIKNGTKVKVYKIKGNWVKISPDKEAWSSKKYIK